VGAAAALFPFPEGELRLDDPPEAAGAFVERYLGFADPVYRALRRGDSRSGEVGVRPVPGGVAGAHRRRFHRGLSAVAAGTGSWLGGRWRRGTRRP
jgi:hypothetical protein